MKTPTTHAATQTEIAEHFKVSRQTVAGWALKKDFPRRSKKGWLIKTVDAWAKANQVGPYREEKTTKGDNGFTLTAARIGHLSKRSIREEIAIEREMMELEIAKGNILLATDVVDLHRQVAATSMTMAEGLPDAIDREAPEQCPTPEAWPEIRQRLILAAKRIAKDLVGAIEGFIASD